MRTSGRPMRDHMITLSDGERQVKTQVGKGIDEILNVSLPSLPIHSSWQARSLEHVAVALKHVVSTHVMGTDIVEKCADEFGAALF